MATAIVLRAPHVLVGGNEVGGAREFLNIILISAPLLWKLTSSGTTVRGVQWNYSIRNYINSRAWKRDHIDLGKRKLEFSFADN